MKLTNTQIQILIDAFFKTADAPPYGVLEIGRQLLSEGQCIVAGNGRLWNGGVGNFIRVTVAEGAVGCALLTFDREAFLSSLWVVETLAHHIEPLRDQVAALEEKVDAVSELLRLATYLRVAS